MYRIIRKARIEDVAKIQKLINQFAKQELMLPRSLSDLYETLRDFWICEYNNRVIACCALHIAWSDLVEIRSLAVEKQYQKKGIGRELVDAALSEAKGIGAASVFTLTYIPKYFKKYGFRKINKEKLPQKIWVECINCPKFPDCEEIALIKRL